MNHTGIFIKRIIKQNMRGYQDGSSTGVKDRVLGNRKTATILIPK